jgi:hypothetical protein
MVIPGSSSRPAQGGRTGRKANRRRGVGQREKTIKPRPGRVAHTTIEPAPYDREVTNRPTGTILPLLLATATGAFAVSVDLHNSEVQAAVLVLVVGGFLLGLAWPGGAWRWALVLGLSILVGDTLALQLHLVARDPEPVNWTALVALIPAFIGTYAGVGVRRLLGVAAGSV